MDDALMPLACKIMTLVCINDMLKTTEINLTIVQKQRIITQKTKKQQKSIFDLHVLKYVG